MGLRPTRWQSMWMKGIYWCRVVSTTMWTKLAYQNLVLQACRIFCWRGIICFGRWFHVLPNVRIEFKSQYVSHMNYNLDGDCFPQDKVMIVDNLTGWIWKTLVHMLLAPRKWGSLPQWPDLAPLALRITDFI